MALVEQKHIDAAMSAGACGVEDIVAGSEVGSVSQGNLIWFEDQCPRLAAESRDEGDPPLWAQAWSGYGDGSGYGYGSGS